LGILLHYLLTVWLSEALVQNQMVRKFNQLSMLNTHTLTHFFYVREPSLIFTGNVNGGAAYVYNVNYDDGSISFIQKLSNTSSMSGDDYGHSVSISGNYVVVGAPQSDGSASNAGEVYVYKKGDAENDLFVFAVALVSPSPNISALFGWSVDVNSNGVIAVGAKGDREARGTVYLFKPDGSGWSHVFTLDPNVTSSRSTVGNFGWDIAIDDS
jgi:hypothetical protein